MKLLVNGFLSAGLYGFCQDSLELVLTNPSGLRSKFQAKYIATVKPKIKIVRKTGTDHWGSVIQAYASLCDSIHSIVTTM